MTTNDYSLWEPVLTDPTSRTPWRIGRRTANGPELAAAQYETWALASDEADALNEATA